MYREQKLHTHIIHKIRLLERFCQLSEVGRFRIFYTLSYAEHYLRLLFLYFLKKNEEKIGTQTETIRII